MSYADIIARLEKFCGDETLTSIEADIASAVGWSPGPAHSRYEDSANWRIDGHVETIAWPPKYTGSIDAALTLVLKGHEWECGSAMLVAQGRWHWARVIARDSEFIGKGPLSAAIALCIAALKAREATGFRERVGRGR